MLKLKVHHTGYLVKNHSQALEAFIALGYQIKQDTVRDELRKIDITFVEKDNSVLEVISPCSDDSTVSKLLPRIKNSPYHICYVSDDIEKDSETLRDMGYLPFTEPQPAIACDNRRVCFFIHPSIGMLELLEN